MPGKVNPTQADAHHGGCRCSATMSQSNVAGGAGNFEPNQFMPVIGAHAAQTWALLTSACGNFEEFCARGIEPNRERIESLLNGR